ncbi:MAG TPA: protein kinase [Candidatus Lustribacter sp.]|jgi:serine/threonine-protein kinase|nr:protein kinase [Candidatus Lustribacter sp.]
MLTDDGAGLAGTIIGERYRIESVLGEGASALVYAAHDKQLDRSVALKIPRLPLGSEAGAGERIVQEVRIAARLHDWHIVTIFDVIEIQHRPIIVMERVRGKSLAAVLRERGALPVPEAVTIGEGIARALAAAHAAGIVHRDVKPSNVLLPEGGGVKLTDFGVARALAEEQAKLTQTGMVVGSVFYIAPELMAGGDAAPAVDLYALGAVMYQMVAGEPPFTGSDPLTIALAHATRPVPSLRGFPEVPPALAQLIERLLAKSPAERPAGAAAVADELSTWSASLAATDPLAAPTVVMAARAAPRRKTAPPRKRPAMTALGVVACVCVTGIVVLARPHGVTAPAVNANPVRAQPLILQTPVARATVRQHAAALTVLSSAPRADVNEDAGTGCGPRSKEQLENDKREIERQKHQVDDDFDGASPGERALVKAQLETQKQAIDVQERQLDQEQVPCIRTSRVWWER